MIGLYVSMFALTNQLKDYEKMILIIYHILGRSTGTATVSSVASADIAAAAVAVFLFITICCIL